MIKPLDMYCRRGYRLGTGVFWRRSKNPHLIALVLVVPFLWMWAWRTDQFPATFGMPAVVEIAWQTRLRRQARSINRS